MAKKLVPSKGDHIMDKAALDLWAAFHGQVSQEQAAEALKILNADPVKAYEAMQRVGGVFRAGFNTAIKARLAE